MTETIQLHLSIPEMNLVLEALSGLPYFKVYELIGKMQTAARQQLQEKERPVPMQDTGIPISAPAAVNGVHAANELAS